MTTAFPPAPRLPAKQASTAAIASSTRHCDRHTLAGGKPVGLDHDRRAATPEIGMSGIAIAEAAIGGGRNAGFGGEVLGVALRALEARRLAARPESGDAGGGEIVNQAGDERRLRTDDDELDGVGAAELADRESVADVECDQVGALGNAGVAGRRVKPGEMGRLGDLPGECMFASARPDEEDVDPAWLALRFAGCRRRKYAPRAFDEDTDDAERDERRYQADDDTKRRDVDRSRNT